jgi:hypothetical protein
MAVIKAIETKYAGYKFRSRLEARWAVFFDTLELDWEYEPQGYVVPTSRGKIKYLPDFWLEGPGQWAEVKGYLDAESMPRLHALASTIARCEEGNDIGIFGDVPRLHSILWPVQLHYHGGLWAVPWDPYEAGCPLARPRVAVQPTPAMAAHLTDGFPFGRPDWAVDALEHARQARFEWGEHG